MKRFFINSLSRVAVFFSTSLIFANSDLVELKTIDFSIKEDIRYASTNNFMKAALYPEAKCLLRKEVAEALSRVQSSLKLKGLGLKVYDCYRPHSIQKLMWEKVHDDRFVADPAKGSVHNRGAALDLTLVDSSGNELEMPSGYDEFTERAHSNFQKASKVALKNRSTLRKAMEREGFSVIPTEWWHFNYKGHDQYPIEDVPFSPPSK